MQDCKLADSECVSDEDSDEKKPMKVERITRKAVQQSGGFICCPMNLNFPFPAAPVLLKRAKLESSLTGIEVAVLQGTSEAVRRKCEEILKHFDAVVVKGISKSSFSNFPIKI